MFNIHHRKPCSVSAFEYFDHKGLVRIVQNSVEPARMANPEISIGRPAAAACPFAALISHCSCLTLYSLGIDHSVASQRELWPQSELLVAAS